MFLLHTSLLLATLVGAVMSRDGQLDGIWKQFKNTHSKNYTAAEEKYRRKIWETNVDVIQQHNLQYDLGLHTYTMGLNEYADLTFAEYRKYLLGARPELSTTSRHEDTRVLFKPFGHTVPDEVDWRTKGFVTPVKNQGQCGSCWAFSSTGSLEGQHFNATGKLVSLSEQNLVDCCKENAGCNGGWMDNAFKYVEENGGLDTEEYYPYQAVETGRCTYSNQDIGTTCKGWVDVTKDEESLKVASAEVGPIAVGIDATHQSFQMYRSGVYVEPDCSSTVTDHAVLVVGYGTDSGQDYWLVKNSWGTSWGDQGYIKMARNQGNMCAIASFPSYPKV